MRRHALRWFRFVSTGQDIWTVLLATRPLIERVCPPSSSESHVLGLTTFDPRLVLVDAGYDRAEQDETLLHEMMHVAAGDSPRALPREQEERAIHTISPMLIPVLRVWGGLRWPRRPPGARAFERFARSQHEET